MFNLIHFLQIFTEAFILNLRPATHPKELGQGQHKIVKVKECSKNTCLEHFTGEQVCWKHVSVMIG